MVVVIFKILFITFRERGREEERQGEKRQCARDTSIGCLSHTPSWGLGPQLCTLAKTPFLHSATGLPNPSTVSWMNTSSHYTVIQSLPVYKNLCLLKVMKIASQVLFYKHYGLALDVSVNSPPGILWDWIV